MMQSQFLKALHLLAMLCLGSVSYRVALAENWPQWRGPRGDSTSEEQNLPLVWSENRGLAWKVELPGWGASTPAVWNDAMFVTAQEDDKLLLMRLETKKGKTVWSRQIDTAETPRTGNPRTEQKFHELQTMPALRP